MQTQSITAISLNVGYLEEPQSPQNNAAYHSPFIEANTVPMQLETIKNEHLIPVFTKDNVPAISQVEFVEVVQEISSKHLGPQKSFLSLRVSHPIQGRIFEARHKRVQDLLEAEKTIYYERMAFVIEFPGIKEVVNGNEVSFCIAGVKSYNLDNLNSIAGAKQTFKVAIGFQVKVCTNLCLWADGTILDVKVSSLEELYHAVHALLETQTLSKQIAQLRLIDKYQLSEQQFATMLGRCRMLSFIPNYLKSGIPQFLISDSQISAITRQYYSSPDFSRNHNGSIDMWKLYNLLTDAVKSSYIDTFLDRNVNAFEFATGICKALDGHGEYQWFLE